MQNIEEKDKTYGKIHCIFIKTLYWMYANLFFTKMDFKQENVVLPKMGKKIWLSVKEL